MRRTHLPCSKLFLIGTMELHSKTYEITRISFYHLVHWRTNIFKLFCNISECISKTTFTRVRAIYLEHSKKRHVWRQRMIVFCSPIATTIAMTCHFAPIIDPRFLDKQQTHWLTSSNLAFQKFLARTASSNDSPPLSNASNCILIHAEKLSILDAISYVVGHKVTILFLMILARRSTYICML